MRDSKNPLNVVGLLLAAGSATRFGSDKLRHPLPHGVSIAVQAARHLKSEMHRVVAVVRPGQEAQQMARSRAARKDNTAVNAAGGTNVKTGFATTR